MKTETVSYQWIFFFFWFSLHHSHLGKSRLPAYYNQMFRLLSNEGENQLHTKWISTVAGKCKSIFNYTFVKHAIVNTGYCCQVSSFITFSVSWSGVTHELSLWPLYFRMLMALCLWCNLPFSIKTVIITLIFIYKAKTFLIWYF